MNQLLRDLITKQHSDFSHNDHLGGWELEKWRQGWSELGIEEEVKAITNYYLLKTGGAACLCKTDGTLKCTLNMLSCREPANIAFAPNCVSGPQCCQNPQSWHFVDDVLINARSTSVSKM